MIVLYSKETCPKCDILKQKLNDKNIEYKIGDNNEIIKLGYRQVPILKINGEYLDYGKAIKWINDM